MKITLSQTARYNDYYNKYTHRVEEVVLRLLPYLRESFDVSEDLVVHIRPIRSKRNSKTHGQSIGQLKVEIDCRATYVWSIANTLAHEFTHAEQKKQGRLTYKYFPEYERSFDVWDFDTVVDRNKAKTYQEYLDLPWEVEARDRAEEFCQKHFMLIDEISRNIESVPYYRRKKSR